MIFEGIFTALITPFKDDQIDFAALEKLIKKQIDANIDGIVIAGSTGEGNNLLESEYYNLVQKSITYAQKKIKIIACFGASSTNEAVSKTKKLCEIGVDAIMCTAPHYVRPEQEGLFLHYKSINDACTVPLMVYINPGRTCCDFADETLVKICNLSNVSSIKDATNDLAKPLRILPKTTNVTMLTGDDPKILSYSANGGAGCVSVISNIIPKTCKKIHDLYKNGNHTEALKLLQNIIPFLNAVFSESNPIGIKAACASLGLCEKEIRLPLTWAKDKNEAIIADLVKNISKSE